MTRPRWMIGRINCKWGVLLLDRILVLDLETLRLSTRMLDLSLEQDEGGIEVLQYGLCVLML